MSLTLTAFPAAFLINPSKYKTINLTQFINKVSGMALMQQNKLFEVKVLTGLTQAQMVLLLHHCAEKISQNLVSTGQNSYVFQNGLKMKFENDGNSCNVVLSGNLARDGGLKFAEGLFNIFDETARTNIRDVGGCEKFYYRYKTDYNNIQTLKRKLLENNAYDIIQISENELSASIDGKSIRFYKNSGEENFSLEFEQKIILVNIGVGNSLNAVEIKTNIKQGELEKLLSGTMYLYDRATSSINLNSGNVPVNFELKDGTYTLKYESKNATAERNELEKLFVIMNKRAGRDLRLIKDKSYVNYIYKTNYLDKGVLINTLLEHGAKNLVEDEGNVYCDLYGMQMAYKRENENSSYDLEILHVMDKKDCETFIQDMNDEYGLNMQEITYRKILERLKTENMNLESEEVTDDNSIVLTIDVG